MTVYKYGELILTVIDGTYHNYTSTVEKRVNELSTLPTTSFGGRCLYQSNPIQRQVTVSTLDQIQYSTGHVFYTPPPTFGSFHSGTFTVDVQFVHTKRPYNGQHYSTGVENFNRFMAVFHRKKTSLLHLCKCE